MKKYRAILIISVVFFSLLGSAAAEAGTYYEFIPSPDADLNDLDHYRYSLWGITWTVPSNEEIVGATFYIDDINNWANEDNDQLFIGLLDSAPAGVTTYYDGQGTSNAIETYAANHSIEYWHLDTYTDINDYPGPSEDYDYIFDEDDLAQLNSFIIDGLWGFGLDADCHYWNNGVKFVIETSPVVPEPGTLSLTLLGVLSGFGLQKRRKTHS